MFSKSALFPIVSMLFVAILAAMASWFAWIKSLDNSFYDFLARQQVLSYPEDIVIIAIDETSIEGLGSWPWDRRLHSQLLKKLEAADAVVFDIIFSEPQLERGALTSHGSSSDSRSINVSDVGTANSERPQGSADFMFSQAILQSNNVLLPVFIEPLQFRGVLQEVLPLPIYAEAASRLAHAHLDHDEDGIARGFFLREGLGQPFWPHLSFALAEFLGEAAADIPGERSLLSDGAEELYEIDSPYLIYRDYYNRIKFSGRADTLYRISYIDVLEGLIPNDTWKDKRVFVGATAQGLGDEVSTPMGLMSGVEFNANAYHALRSGATVTAVGNRFHAFTTLVTLMVMTSLLSRLAPLPFLLASLSGGLLAAFLSASLFWFSNIWYSPIACILALMLFYPLTTQLNQQVSDELIQRRKASVN